VSFFASRSPEVLYFITPPKLAEYAKRPLDFPKLVALTIDDGPYPSTPNLLKCLSSHSVRSTLFLIGSHVEKYNTTTIDSYPHKSLLDWIRRDGHEIGNHTMSLRSSISLTLPQLEDEIIRNERLLSLPPGNNSSQQKLFRPGSGFYNTGMLSLAKKLGYRVVLGDVYPHDPLISSSYINSRLILSRVQPGSIIILHDRPYTPKTLDIVLPTLKQMGYEVTTVGEMVRRYLLAEKQLESLSSYG